MSVPSLPVTVDGEAAAFLQLVASLVEEFLDDAGCGCPYCDCDELPTSDNETRPDGVEP